MMENRDQSSAGDFQIQTLAVSDTARLLAFYQSLPESVTQVFSPFGEADEAKLQRHLEETQQGKHVSLGLVNPKGELTGHVMIFNIDSDQPIFGIGLKPEMQGKGWGKRMAEAVLRVADERKKSVVTLTVVKTNTAAKAMYEKLGFRLRGDATFRQQNDSYSMERTLGSTEATAI